ncbi:MAG: hypothetical protein VX341_06440 [Bdellovibrionota bacterium]|nr:hypothetical protein [Bdellovibrionota bacterium]
MKKFIIGLTIFSTMAFASDRSLNISCINDEGAQFSALFYEYSDGSVDYSDDHSGELYMTGGDLDMPGSIDSIKRSFSNNSDELVVSYNVKQKLFVPLFGLKIGTYHQHLELSINKNTGEGEYSYSQSEPGEDKIKINQSLSNCSFKED